MIYLKTLEIAPNFKKFHKTNSQNDLDIPKKFLLIVLFIHFYIFIFTTYILIVNNFTLIVFLRLILVVLDWYLKVRAELKLLFNINVKENLWFLVQDKCRKNDFQNILKQPVFLKMFLAKNIFPLKTFYAKQTKASKSVALIMVTSFVLHKISMGGSQF